MLVESQDLPQQDGCKAGDDVEECGENEPVIISNPTLHIVSMKGQRARGKVPSPGQRQGVCRIYEIYSYMPSVPSTRSIYSLFTRRSIAYILLRTKL